MRRRGFISALVSLIGCESMARSGLAGRLSGPAETGQGWYVDSAGGSDGNDGNSAQLPFATVSAVAAVAAQGDTVYLKRGSVFREELTGLPRFIVVRTYGTGDRPIVDGADVALNASFTKTPGYTNIYQISWSHGFSADKCAHRVWENGIRLSRVATMTTLQATALATLDTIPGGFWASTPTTGGPDTVYVHASGSANPISNGRTYELTRRRWAVQLYQYDDHATLIGVQGQRNAHADGSVVFDGAAYDCWAVDGRIHNMFVRGLAEDCVAYKMEPQRQFGQATMFVTYRDTVSDDGTTYRRCRCVPDEDTYGDGVANNANLTLGFYAHTAGPTHLGELRYEQCEVQDLVLGWGGSNMVNGTYVDCETTNVLNAFQVFPNNTLYILGGTHLARASGTPRFVDYATDFGSPPSIVIKGVRYYSQVRAQFCTIKVNIANVEIAHNTFTTGADSSVLLQDGTFIFEHNIVFTTSSSGVLTRVYDTAAYTRVDHNLYYSQGLAYGAIFQTSIGGVLTTYQGLAPWQAATPHDDNSVVADPQFTGSVSALDFTLSPSSPAHALEAGADYYEAV